MSLGSGRNTQGHVSENEVERRKNRVSGGSEREIEEREGMRRQGKEEGRAASYTPILVDLGKIN